MIPMRPSSVATEPVIVNESFARRIWPGADPLGKVLRVARSNSKVEVVGVARARRLHLGRRRRATHLHTMASRPFAVFCFAPSRKRSRTTAESAVSRHQAGDSHRGHRRQTHPSLDERIDADAVAACFHDCRPRRRRAAADDYRNLRCSGLFRRRAAARRSASAWPSAPVQWTCCEL